MNNKGINTAARLRKVSKAITEHADQFQMGAIFSSLLDDYSPAGGCGTAACIAGWAVHLFHPRKAKTLNDSQEAGGWIAGRIFLGLDGDEATRLFQTSYWPVRFEAKFDTAKRASTRARIAAARIEHFIKTKGKE